MSKLPPRKRAFRCPEHGRMLESGVFPGTLGVFVEKYPNGPKSRICPICFYNLLKRECFELQEIQEDDDVETEG